MNRAAQLFHAAMNHQGVRSIGVALAIERLKFYARIVKGNPSQAVFIVGWVNRATEFL